MKTQIATTIEQSRRLLACSVDPNTADMHWCDFIPDEPFLAIGEVPRDNESGIVLDEKDVPAWSLSAIISLLPNRVFNHEKRVECGLTWIKRNDDAFSAGYMGLTQRIEPVEPFKTEDKSLFEVCVQMIEWLTAEGYSLNKTEH